MIGHVQQKISAHCTQAYHSEIKQVVFHVVKMSLKLGILKYSKPIRVYRFAIHKKTSYFVVLTTPAQSYQ
jgi:hypothetical protein